MFPMFLIPSFKTLTTAGEQRGEEANMVRELSGDT